MRMMATVLKSCLENDENDGSNFEILLYFETAIVAE